MNRIITRHEFPPIPTRQFDWVAWLDGREEEGPWAYGPTEQAAVEELEREMREREEDENGR